MLLILLAGKVNIQEYINAHCGELHRLDENARLQN